MSLNRFLMALLVAFAAAAADCDVIRLTSGRVIEGRIVEESPEIVRIETMISGIRATLRYRPSQIDSIERKPLPEGFFDPKPRTPEEPEAKPRPEPDRSPPAPAAARTAPSIYAAIPVEGTVGEAITALGLETALEQAKRRRVTHVVFQVDSPGGYLYEAEALIEVLRAFEEEFTYVALIVVGGAFSAATIFMAAADEILVRPGGSMGAATAYAQDTSTGSAQVDAKLNSGWASRLAGLAETRGHAGEPFRAMVEMPVQLFGNPDSDEFSIRAVRGPGWELLDGPRTILTLRADQIERFGVGRVFDGDLRELGEVLGIESWRSGGARYGRAFAAQGQKRVELQEAMQAEHGVYSRTVDAFNGMTVTDSTSGRLALSRLDEMLRSLERMAALNAEAQETGALHIEIPDEAGHDAYVRTKQVRDDLARQLGG
ncbi:MAG: hypothetical protein AAFU70_01630 [Planctomycetota bacterium]